MCCSLLHSSQVLLTQTFPFLSPLIVDYSIQYLLGLIFKEEENSNTLYRFLQAQLYQYKHVGTKYFFHRHHLHWLLFSLACMLIMLIVSQERGPHPSQQGIIPDYVTMNIDITGQLELMLIKSTLCGYLRHSSEQEFQLSVHTVASPSCFLDDL